MTNFSFANKHKLARDIDIALEDGAQFDEKSTAELSSIKDFHDQLEANPEKAFNRLVQAIRAKIPLTAKDDLTPLSALLVGLDSRIKEIKDHELQGFMPKGAENSPSTRWQYRYGLLVSCLKDWQEQQKDNQDPVIQGYVS
ncbi:MAG: hypothetical protein P4M14_01370, partial [Gammaproteobacteria bacterium]|nr:hypothetical protein [Gammaproteobacteria bacterium]